jgi:hypothetical protein
LVGNISDTRGGSHGQVRFPVQLVEWKLTTRIKTISLGVIARFKSENPDFDIDFETFVKELTTDETVIDVDGMVN